MKTSGLNYNSARDWFNKTLLSNTTKALIKRGFKANFFMDEKGLMKTLSRRIPKNSTIGIPGSVTIRQLGIIEKLKKRGNKIYQHWEKGLTEETDKEPRRLEGEADYYLTSANAITTRGEIINIDGVGNRVAHMIFGPKNVFIIAGINKIVNSIEQGIERAHNIAGVKNAKRVSADVPCTRTGTCQNCNTRKRICRITTIIHYCPFQTDISVFLINKNLGF